MLGKVARARAETVQRHPERRSIGRSEHAGPKGRQRELAIMADRPGVRENERGRGSPARVPSMMLAPSVQEWGTSMSTDDDMPSADQVEAAEAGRPTHPQEPHAGGIAGR